MNRENLLFAIIGVLLGFIAGFMLSNSMNQRLATPATSARTQNLPPDHPTVGDSAPAPGQMQADVQAALSKARSEPNNIDAQMKAAELYYQIQRYDQAIEYLLKANQIQPDNYETIADLGMVNMDAGHFEAAERWWKAALVKKPDDLRVLDGLCFTQLQKGDAKSAEDTMNKLAKADPSNQDLQHFRDQLAQLKTVKK